jgi:hypothetical protein
MATTTNYSWTTPDDTALVKDGAAAIRSLGTAIDTTVFNNASAAIVKTIVDAKGDIIAATAADTVARLAVGANDTVLTADSSTATGLKWSAPVTPTRAYAIFFDQKAVNTDGGTFTSGAFRTRDLQTTQVNTITGCSLASNQVTLPAGTYYVYARLPCFSVNRNEGRLRNITDSTTAILGTVNYSEYPVNNAVEIVGVFTIAGTKTFELQHYSNTTQAGSGFGIGDGNALGGQNLVYSIISIEKIG